VNEVTPREALFEQASGVEGELAAAGFLAVEVEAHTLESVLPLDHFLSDRAMGAAGRCARHALGEAGWREFLEDARPRLRASFGSTLRVARGILVGRGRRPA
jgi:hypothetical protein